VTAGPPGLCGVPNAEDGALVSRTERQVDIAGEIQEVNSSFHEVLPGRSRNISGHDQGRKAGAALQVAFATMAFREARSKNEVFN